MVASAESFSSVLGRFDLLAMRRLHRLADKHTSAVVASLGNPLDYIPDTALVEFADTASDLWMRFALMSPFPIAETAVASAITRATASYQDLLELLIGRRIFDQPVMGEFIVGSTVQYGDIRPVLATLGGGATDTTVQLQGGIGTGTIFADAAAAQGVPLGNERIWLYGLDEQPRRVFNGHLQMDGLVFTDWDDDGLLISPQDAWLRTEYYYPGDHIGCSCVVAPYVPNLGDQFDITLMPSE
jgi:hypothetical protein